MFSASLSSLIDVGHRAAHTFNEVNQQNEVKWRRKKYKKNEDDDGVDNRTISFSLRARRNFFINTIQFANFRCVIILASIQIYSSLRNGQEDKIQISTRKKKE